jgi:glycosyltransferase involved in cell wall biosynthesis
MGFSEPETYYQMVKHVRAEIGIAPLVDNRFNQSKSNLKFVEYSVIGMPTVASRVAPYENAIEDGKNGFLVSSPEEWYLALKGLLGNETNRKSILTEARKYVAENHDIRKVALKWAEILCK